MTLSNHLMSYSHSLVARVLIQTRKYFPYSVVGSRYAYICFVLKYLLGYSNIRNYDGSWNEWSNLPNVAIEK
jgi:3-mercaptopyruvate sulfurtransferase SseA